METDICIGADYWHFLPQYIEQEKRKGPLQLLAVDTT
jgi:hypothetical protein